MSIGNKIKSVCGVISCVTKSINRHIMTQIFTQHKIVVIQISYFLIIYWNLLFVSNIKQCIKGDNPYIFVEF